MDKFLKFFNSIICILIFAAVIGFPLLCVIGAAFIEHDFLSALLGFISFLLFIDLVIDLFKHKKSNIINEPNILFAKTRADARIPTREKGNAGFDIYGLIPYDDINKMNGIIVNPHETKLIPTGIKSIIPKGYYIQIQERGSSGSKGIKYSAGVIDSSYRGEWFLATTNVNDKPVIFYNDAWAENVNKPEYSDCILYPLSKAIFQGVIHSTHSDIDSMEVSLDVVKNSTTDRGEGKLGSSGK